MDKGTRNACFSPHQFVDFTPNITREPSMDGVALFHGYGKGVVVDVCGL